MSWRPLPNEQGDPPVSISAPLDRVMESLGAPPPATTKSLFDSWSAIVGTAISSAATPVSLARGVLAITVQDGGWASQLRWMETTLVAKINAELGEGTVERFDVRVRPE